MSDEPRNDNLLVDQNEALDFYFDSMLLPDENDIIDEDNEPLTEENDALTGTDESIEATPSALPAAEKNKEENERLEQQSAKDFLQRSKQRQNKKRQNNQYQKSKSAQVLKSEQALETEAPVAGSSTVITKVPPSPKQGAPKPRVPKPRVPKPGTAELADKKPTTMQSIVFSSKNNEGEVSDQVLIPRSQRLAALKQKTHSDNTGRHSQSVNHNVSKNIASQPASSIKESVQEIELKNYSQEAPNLDLSLFLPKIKTLSDTEIAQQIEALTQAAVAKSQQQQESQIVTKPTQSEADNGLIRNINNAPSWAVSDFQVLLFAVAGLKLAVPLNELNGIVEWGDEYITELPGHKPWYLGIIQNQGKNVPVIDTLQQVVPKERWPAEHLHKKNFKHIILIDDNHWGLACETVLEVITLKTDSVKWRSSRTKRRWLSGTVIEHMCALLDSSEFAAMLKTGDDSLLS